MADHDRFEKMLLSVSSPNHADYGKHLTRDEIKVSLNVSLKFSHLSLEDELASTSLESTPLILSDLHGYSSIVLP